MHRSVELTLNLARADEAWGTFAKHSPVRACRLTETSGFSLQLQSCLYPRLAFERQYARPGGRHRSWFRTSVRRSCGGQPVLGGHVQAHCPALGRCALPGFWVAGGLRALHVRSVEFEEG